MNVESTLQTTYQMHCIAVSSQYKMCELTLKNRTTWLCDDSQNQMKMLQAIDTKTARSE